ARILDEEGETGRKQGASGTRPAAPTTDGGAAQACLVREARWLVQRVDEGADDSGRGAGTSAGGGGGTVCCSTRKGGGLWATARRMRTPCVGESWSRTSTSSSSESDDEMEIASRRVGGCEADTAGREGRGAIGGTGERKGDDPAGLRSQVDGREGNGVLAGTRCLDWGRVSRKALEDEGLDEPGGAQRHWEGRHLRCRKSGKERGKEQSGRTDKVVVAAFVRRRASSSTGLPCGRALVFVFVDSLRREGERRAPRDRIVRTDKARVLALARSGKFWIILLLYGQRREVLGRERAYVEGGWPEGFSLRLRGMSQWYEAAGERDRRTGGGVRGDATELRAGRDVGRVDKCGMGEGNPREAVVARAVRLDRAGYIGLRRGCGRRREGFRDYNVWEKERHTEEEERSGVDRVLVARGDAEKSASGEAIGGDGLGTEDTGEGGVFAQAPSGGDDAPGGVLKVVSGVTRVREECVGRSAEEIGDPVIEVNEDVGVAVERDVNVAGGGAGNAQRRGRTQARGVQEVNDQARLSQYETEREGQKAHDIGEREKREVETDRGGSADNRSRRESAVEGAGRGLRLSLPLGLLAAERVGLRSAGFGGEFVHYAELALLRQRPGMREGPRENGDGVGPNRARFHRRQRRGDDGVGERAAGSVGGARRKASAGCSSRMLHAGEEEGEGKPRGRQETNREEFGAARGGKAAHGPGGVAEGGDGGLLRLAGLVGVERMDAQAQLGCGSRDLGRAGGEGGAKTTEEAYDFIAGAEESGTVALGASSTGLEEWHEHRRPESGKRVGNIGSLKRAGNPATNAWERIDGPMHCPPPQSANLSLSVGFLKQLAVMMPIFWPPSTQLVRKI
ncbi:hypothetical protein DFH09DRAFT_1116899, partial [Mycena vulgaris]